MATTNNYDAKTMATHYFAVKLDKTTGEVCAERAFTDKDAALAFVHEVGKLGYKPCTCGTMLYDSEKYMLGIV